MKLTDPDVLNDLVLQHPDMGVMREYHQKKNGFNDSLHEMMDKGHISPEVANQLSQKMCAQFYQHYAMPILIESFRANLINQIPRVLNQLETAVKGLRLHVGARVDTAYPNILGSTIFKLFKSRWVPGCIAAGRIP